ncbi:MAG: glycosyltransferase family 2 protein [Chitinispirillaceae bacterium]|nr:glycosyltransferase family 2 protein [Chitinispirillaceae bacterium]
MRKYVLITPAKNESVHIGKTITTVDNQTEKPHKWIIVNDHSRDSTEDTIKKSIGEKPYIVYVNNTLPQEIGFASKVQSFNLGYTLVKYEEFDFIGNLDADVSFEKSYFKNVMDLFESNKKLGIAGGRVHEIKNERWLPHQSSTNSVAGAVQFFRRSCFEQIGGFIPMTIGGEDSAAEIVARSQGWKVFTDKSLNVFHHKKMLTGNSTVFAARFKQGMSNYILGYHPLFHFLSCISRVTEKPYIIASTGLAIGFLSAWIRKMERKLSDTTIEHLRREQLKRIKQIFSFKTDTE